MSEPIGGDVADVDQREADVLAGRPIPVAVAGPVRVQQLPATSWSSRTRTVAPADGPIKLASADPRRRSLTIVANQPVYVAGDPASCAQQVAARWPANVPMLLTHREDVYVQAVAGEHGPYGDPETVAIPNPGLGVDNFAVTVPAGESWVLLSLRCSISTSAVVANRFPAVNFLGPTGAALVDLSAPTAQPASISRTYNWYLGGGSPSASGQVGLSLPEGYPLMPGSAVTGKVFGFDAGDAITQITMVIRKSSHAGCTVSVAEELWAE